LEKHFPSAAEQNRSVSMLHYSTNPIDQSLSNSKKRKSMHQRTTKRSIFGNSNADSDDSDVEYYSSFHPSTNKRRATGKHRDQNNNNAIDEIHNSDPENGSDVGFFIEQNYLPLQHQSYACTEPFEQLEVEGALPIKRIAKKEAPIDAKHCTTLTLLSCIHFIIHLR
jgi:hypothetical protein